MTDDTVAALWSVGAVVTGAGAGTLLANLIIGRRPFRRHYPPSKR